MKPLKEFIDKPNVTEGIKSGACIAGMLEYAHNNPPQTIVVEYTKLRWPGNNNEHSRGTLRLTSTGEKFDTFRKKFLISGTGVKFKGLECIVYTGRDKDHYLMVDVIGGKNGHEPQIYIEYDNYYYE